MGWDNQLSEFDWTLKNQREKQAFKCEGPKKRDYQGPGHGKEKIKNKKIQNQLLIRRKTKEGRGGRETTTVPL